MGLDDVFSTESAFVAAATAAVFSPRTRETLRRGAVLGVAGVLKAGDVVAGAARGASRGVRSQVSSNGSGGGPSRSAPGRTASASTSSGSRSARAKGGSSSS